jgi:hypothetical protein
MNKRLLFISVVLMLSILACSFGSIIPARVIGSGNVISETRSVSGFSSINLQGSAAVNVTFGPTESVVVKADDNILPLIETTVQGDKLVIATKSNANITNAGLVLVSITMKSIQDLTLSGSGNIVVTGLAGKNLAVSLPGSGNITVNGSADSVNIKLPGSGNIFCNGLKAHAVTVSLSGSGNIDVYASESLDANILGSGAIHYDGNPARVTKSVTGSGSITP